MWMRNTIHVKDPGFPTPLLHYWMNVATPSCSEPDLTVYGGVLIKAGTACPLRAPEVTPGLLVRSVLFNVFLSFFVLFYCVFTFLATCSAWCPLRFPMFDSSLSPVVCGRTRVLFIYVICVWLRIVLSNTYCVVLLLCLSSSCVLCLVCPILPVCLGCLFSIALRCSLTFQR
jgi:hypothetical protein